MESRSLQAHRGAVILVLGILSLTACVPLGIAAWTLGDLDLRAMDQGRMDPAGRDLTQAGRICGIVGTVLFALALVWAAVWAAVMLSLMAAVWPA
jgi:hypothetical protein